MAIINTGKAFTNGEQLTAAKINKAFTDATFNSGAVDSSTIIVNSDGKLVVNQITTSNIANNAIETDDIEQIATNVLLGRTSTGTGNIEQLSMGTNDDSSGSASGTGYAITNAKETSIGSLKIKTGELKITSTSAVTVAFPTAFSTNHLGLSLQLHNSAGGTFADFREKINSLSTTGFVIDINDNLTVSGDGQEYFYISIGN